MDPRLAGLDVGDKRIGVAVADPLGITAQAVGVVERRSKKADAAAILDLLEPYQPIAAFVAGLPFELDQREGVQADRVRHFCAHLEEVTGLGVHFQDERMTTRQSERVLIEANVRRGKRKQVVDKMAAALILQSHLDTYGGSLPS